MASRTVASVQTRAYDELLRILREVRESAGISQETLSRKLGRARTFISKIEAGTRRIDVIELFLIAEATGRDPVELCRDIARRTKGFKA